MYNQSLLLSTYINTVNGEIYALFGPIENIAGYLSTKFKKVYVIFQPMPGECDLTPSLNHYIAGKLIWQKPLPMWLRIFYFVNSDKLNSNQTVIRLKIRDFISNIYFIMFGIRERIDLFIGVESINALGGVFLRAINYVRSVVYFSNDYHIQRYTPVKNWLFLKLDEVAACRSNAIWMMNPAIHTSRLQRGLNDSLLAPHFIIHGGLPFFPRGPLPIVSRDRNRIVYATRASFFGMDLVLRAFAIVIRKYSNMQLYVTGNVHPAEHVAALESLGLASRVVYTGFLKEEDLNRLVEGSYIGLAIYPNDKPSSSTYGDPEKIRRYIHYGLPVIASGTGYTVEKITENGVGLVVDDSVEAVSGAILKLIEDNDLYAACAESAAKLGRAYRENNLIDRAFNDMQDKKIF